MYYHGLMDNCISNVNISILLFLLDPVQYGESMFRSRYHDVGFIARTQQDFLLCCCCCCCLLIPELGCLAVKIWCIKVTMESIKAYYYRNDLSLL